MTRDEGTGRTGSVTVRLYANLARFAGETTRPISVPLEPLETVGGLMARLGIPEEEVSAVFVNGEGTSDRGISLRPGDEIRFLGLVDGG